MRKLTDVANIDAPSSDYPKGRVRDKNGAIVGTTYSEALHGDIIQLFQKVLIDSGLTENDLPDNVTNGYQLLTALKGSIYKINSDSTIIAANVTTSELDIISLVADANVNFSKLKMTSTFQFTHPTTGSNAALTFKFFVNGVLTDQVQQTIFTDGRSEIVSFCFNVGAYTAGDVVKVTAVTSGGVVVFSKGELITEGSN